MGLAAGGVASGWGGGLAVYTRGLDLEGLVGGMSWWELRASTLPSQPVSLAIESVMPPTEPPKAFISYSWESDDHKKWTKALATRLRTDGIDVTLDQWELVPGDQLPRFMETAISGNNYVLILCTPNYRQKSDARTGGAGYEGDIMTAEVLTTGNHRKFIPVLRSGSRETSMPSWLKGKYSVDLSGEPYSEDSYHDLLATLHNQREQAPPLGKPPAPKSTAKKSIREEVKALLPTKESADADFDPIKIEGVLADEVGSPRNDGSRGSALYTIPLKLNRRPTHEWGELFRRAWDHPPQFTPRHRPGIASVRGDRIVLVGTTIEEVRDVHRETLKLAVEVANQEAAGIVRKRRAAEEAAKRKEQEHRDRIREATDGLGFD